MHRRGITLWRVRVLPRTQTRPSMYEGDAAGFSSRSVSIPSSNGLERDSNGTFICTTDSVGIVSGVACLLPSTASIVSATPSTGTFTCTTGSVGTTGFAACFGSVGTIQHVATTGCVSRIESVASGVAQLYAIHTGRIPTASSELLSRR